jgi:hypothetical protein
MASQVPIWFYALGSAGFIALTLWVLKMVWNRINTLETEIDALEEELHKVKEYYVSQRQFDKTVDGLYSRLDSIHNLLIKMIADKNA